MNLRKSALQTTGFYTVLKSRSKVSQGHLAL